MNARSALIQLSAAVALIVCTASAFATTASNLLVNHHGQPVSSDSLRGRVLLVYFGFASCPEACPTALTKLRGVLDLLGEQGEQIVPLFVTVNPTHDTPQVLSEYVRHFHPRLIGLTGSEDSIEAAARTFGVSISTTPREGQPPRIDHSLFIYLVDRQGKVSRAMHPDQTPQQIAAQIRASLGRE